VSRRRGDEGDSDFADAFKLLGGVIGTVGPCLDLLEGPGADVEYRAARGGDAVHGSSVPHAAQRSTGGAPDIHGPAFAEGQSECFLQLLVLGLKLADRVGSRLQSQ
jgi:hypothetical protein